MPKCAMPSCSNNVEIGKNGKWKLHCSTLCRGRHNSMIGTEKRKQTCLERFGATTNLKTQETKDKIKNTLLEKYGVYHQMHIPETKDKIKNTLLEKYGVDNISKSKEIKEKKKDSYLQHYGVEHPLQSDIVQTNRRIRSLEKYGVDHYSKTLMFKDNHANQSHIDPENFKKLKDPGWLESVNNYTYSYIANLLGVTKDTVAKSYKRLNVLHTAISYTGESELLEFIQTLYSGKVITNTRKVIPPKELDIYIPGLNLAFEFDGIYWHSELRGKDKNYHINKTKQCEEYGIRLVHIFENEWLERSDIVKSRIRNLLGKSTKIHARKCKIRELLSNESTEFFKLNHIQGSTRSNLCYGLEFNGEIVAAMSFGIPRFNKSVQWELIRFSNKLNHSVVGGAGKLFNYFIKSHSPVSIVSYSDNRWNTGNLYRQLNFNIFNNGPPAYHYTKDYITLENRVKYQKHKLPNLLENFDHILSEWANMQANGYDRIWDCGNTTYMWNADVISRYLTGQYFNK